MQKYLLLFLSSFLSYFATNAQQTILMGSTSTVYTCDANFYDSGDLFGNYSDNENSVLTFFPDIPGRAIVAYGTPYLSGNDRLRIFCGPDTLSPLLGTFYDGNSFWVTGTNLDGALTFHFISDGASVSSGWEATVYCADYTPFQVSPCFMGCGGEHWFSDPGFGGPYAPNTDMVQTIYPVNAANAVEISYFRDFDLGTGDYLEVHDGPSVFSPVLATYDQGNIPDAVYLHSTHPTGAITLHFVSDGFDEGLGFAGYGNGCVPTPIPDCPFQDTPYDGALVNTNGTQQLVWTPNNFSGAYVAEYNVYFGTDPNPAYVGTTTDTFFTVTNLLPSTQYYWWAEAVNPAGVSVACYIYNFTTSSQLTFLELFPYSGQVLEGDGIQLAIDAANVDNLNLYYSTDGGLNYYPWAFNEPFTNNYVWVPIPTSGLVTFKVEDASNPLLFDTIQVYVDPLILSLVSPNPGQEFLTYDNFNVQWASNFPIPLLSDNNVQLMIMQLPSGPWDYFFNFNFGSGSSINEIDYFSSYIAGSLTSGEYLMKVFPNFGDGDEMTSPFFIKDIIITSPNGNEELTAGTVFPITAQSLIDDTYTLQFSTDGGVTWQVITNNFIIDNSISSTTTFNWTVPNIGSNNCFVRLIKPSAPGVVFDQSNSPFSILCNITASATANGSTTFCQGGSVQLTANTGTGYSYIWKLNGINIPNATNASYVASSSGSYTVVVYVNGCSATSSPINITVTNSPSSPVLSVINNCGNSTITASGVTGTLTWSDGGSGNPRTVSAGTYTVTQTLNGCTSVSSNSVTANPIAIPNAPVLSVINNCGNSTITASGVTGTLTWSDGGSGNPRTVSAGTYTVTQTLNGCTSVSSNSVTANPIAIPNAPVLSVINNCGNSTITASGVTGTLTWSDGGSGNPRTVSAGTYTVTQTLNGCSSVSSNSVTANPIAIPNAPVLGVINNCGNSTITASGVTGTLTWSDGGSGNPRTVSAGTYSVTQTLNGCSSVSSNSVTANPNTFPTTSSIAGNANPQCNGTGIVYNVVLQSGSNYLWQVPNGAVITQGNTGPNNNSITVNFGNSNGFISVTETNANGCVGTTQTLSVLLQGCGLSANFVANNTSVCSGNTITFTDISTGTSANTIYSWNFGPNANPSTINGPGPHVVEYNGVGLNTVSLTITDGASSTFTQTDYITINPIPTAPLLSIVNNCTSSEITASGYTGSLNWSDNGSGNPRIVTTGDFSVTQTVNGCQSASSNLVSANPLGLPPTPLLSVVNNCGNATITATGVTGLLTWSDGGSGNPRTVSAGTFTVFQTVNGCASANSNAVTASPFNVPNTSIINGNQTPNCLASGVNYAVSLTQGSTYAWTVPSGATITAGNSGVNNNSILVNFGNINGNITVVETTTNSCVGAIQTLAINLQGCGLTAGFMVNNTSICSGSDILFTDISTGTTGATTYLWNFGANAVPSSATGPGPHLVTYVGSGSSTATLTINDGITSTYTLPNPISVNANPVASITVNGSTSICAGDSVQLEANSGLGYIYEWRLNNAILSNALNADFYAYAGGFYKVAISVNGCTTISDSILINYLNVPSMPIITLNATQLNSNYSNSNQWFLNGILLPNDTMSFINISANGNYTVCYTNSNGCSACSDPFVITNLNNYSNQNSFVVYPNPFNEMLYIKNVNNSKHLINVELYDNTGKMLYFNSGFNTNDEIKLTDLAKGVYFLKITEQDGSFSYLKLVK